MFLNSDKPFSVFSNKGKLQQCDNALKAALSSSVCIGASSKDGCVLMSYKNLGKLFVKEKYHKIFYVCPSIGLTYSGLQPDFRVQLSIAQKICQEYFDVFERFPYLDTFINEFSLATQEFTQKSRFRPFGTFLIFAGTTVNGPCLYQVDPSGSFKTVEVIAGGVEYDKARKFVERRLSGLDDNIATCFHALREYSGATINPKDISVGVFLSKTGEFKVYDIEDIREIFESIEE